jgi:hypothetical protein
MGIWILECQSQGSLSFGFWSDSVSCSIPQHFLVSSAKCSLVPILTLKVHMYMEYKIRNYESPLSSCPGLSPRKAGSWILVKYKIEGWFILNQAVRKFSQRWIFQISHFPAIRNLNSQIRSQTVLTSFLLPHTMKNHLRLLKVELKRIIKAGSLP